MGWRGDLVTRLRADAALTAAVGVRVAWFEAARGWEAYPLLAMQEISAGREYTHDGPDGLDEPQVQFDIYGVSAAEVEAVEDALMAEMETAAVDAGSTRFHMGFLQRRNAGKPEDLADGRRIFRMTLDYLFHWETI